MKAEEEPISGKGGRLASAVVARETDGSHVRSIQQIMINMTKV
jgi:hypothetical protein